MICVWKAIEIAKGNHTLFCNSYISGKDAMNIIVTHTPIVSTTEIKQCYEPFLKHNVNIFAFDFSGTGRSGGNPSDFSLATMQSDMDAMVEYIGVNYSGDIHLYGTAGIGGMFGQQTLHSSTKIKSFAQFACAEFRNMDGIGYPYILAKSVYEVLKRLPMFHITMKPPKYMGKYHQKDNEFYRDLALRVPNLWKTNSRILQTVLACFVEENLSTYKGPSIPTLVFKTLHDRYFKPTYFDSYFESLSCKKSLIEIDDVHNSYSIESDVFCEEAFKWFVENQ